MLVLLCLSATISALAARPADGPPFVISNSTDPHLETTVPPLHLLKRKRLPESHLGGTVSLVRSSATKDAPAPASKLPDTDVLPPGPPAVDKATLRTVSLVRSKSAVGRLILLLCRRQCFKQRTQVPEWVREFNDLRNISVPGQQIGYHFLITRRTFDFFGVGTVPPERFPLIVYIVGGQSFHFTGNINSKKEFMEFLERHEAISASHITDWQHLENVINFAQQCSGDKQLLLISDPQRCPMPHFDNIVRSLQGSPNYSFYELQNPLEVETEVELTGRLRQLPSLCQFLILMQNNGYTWTSADKDTDEIRAIVKEWENEECPLVAEGWTPIRDALSDVQRAFLREEKKSVALERKHSYILVGATGGIAVVALAISIFWGLNGTSFINK